MHPKHNPQSQQAEGQRAGHQTEQKKRSGIS